MHKWILALALVGAAGVTYEDMLKLCHNADNFQMPTAQEIKLLGALWPQVPPEENAAYYFAKAAHEMAPKKAAPDGAGASEKPYAGDVAGFQKWVEINQPALNLMRQGFEQKTCRPLILFRRAKGQPAGPDEMAPDVMSMVALRSLARLCTDAGFLAELRGKPDAAAEAYEDCLRLGTPTRRQGVLIEALTGLAVSQMGRNALDRLVANSTMGEEALKKVILRCQEAEIEADEPARLWANECAFGEAYMKLHGDDGESAIMFETWRKQRTAATAIVAKKTLPELLQQKTLQEISGTGAKQPGQMQDSTIPYLARGFEEAGRKDVLFKETEIRAAIALYQMKHGGALPESLDALVPDILPAVPTDPYSGKPMRYAKTAQGWKLWSVGADNTDHGGQGDPDPSKVWNGPDYVFVSNIPSNLQERSRPKGEPAAPTAEAAPGTPLTLPKATDADLAALKDKKDLRELDLTGSKITDAGLAYLKEMKSLTTLNLEKTRVTDAGLAQLKEMKGLLRLHLASTKVTDAGVAQLKEMTALQTLGLDGTLVTDAAVPDLKGLTGLKILLLNGSKVTDAGVAELKAALPKARIFK